MKKKFLRVAMCASLMMCACSKAEVQAETVEVERLYIRETVVYEFVPAEDEVVVEDSQGNLYAFYGIEDWEINDRCVLLMDDMGTESIEDDEIIRTFYRR